MDFFASRGGVIYLAELGTAAEVAEERGCRRWWGEAGRAGGAEGGIAGGGRGEAEVEVTRLE